jgi:hypothetical protein
VRVSVHEVYRFHRAEAVRWMAVPSPDRQACVLGILRKESPASTKRIIELASTAEFQEVCRDCRSGIEVYETALKLQQTGMITRTPGKGGFVWALVERSGQEPEC